MNKRCSALWGPARSISDAHDSRGHSSTYQGNLSQWFSDVGSLSIARVLTLLLAWCPPLREYFPQKSGYCGRGRRAKILSSPRMSPGSEIEERQSAHTAGTGLRYW